MTSKRTTCYFRAATLLQSIIAGLRKRQKAHPEMKNEYEQQIAFLFENYSRFLEMDAVFFRKTAFCKEEAT